MKIKTTIELLDDYDSQTGNPPYPLDDTKWVSVDDLILWIKHLNDKTAFNQYQIRKTTILNKLRGRG